MHRRELLKTVVLLPLVNACSRSGASQNAHSTQSPIKEANATMSFTPLNKSKAEWQELLEPKRYQILFEAATERAGSSPLDKVYDEGTYVCAACKLPLFSSDDKFDSGTGWPSFTKPIIEENIGKTTDYKLIYPRTEYHCARCGGHQGHVFKDGPKPRGQRWCNNGLALNFIAKGDDLPELVS